LHFEGLFNDFGVTFIHSKAFITQMDSFGWGLNQETPLNTPTVEDISVVDARFYFWQVGVERSCGVLPSVQLLIV